MNFWLIIIAFAIAFLLQSLLGFLQIKNFVKTFRSMCEDGKVLIGKNPKKVKTGTLLLLNIDKNANIKNAKIMKGVSVFARFKNFNSLNGKSLPYLASSYEEMSEYNKLTQECILNAYRNYINFKTGKMSRSDWETSTNFLSLPVFLLWKNNLIFKVKTLSRKLSK